jgi:8-oxo-dGTP pyrophosphatase MutT (NUDIX family)
VFSHPGFPEAGIQVPAGTVRATESPAEAVLREAREETGLQELVVVARLGTVDYDMSAFGRPEVHRRHFYHLEFGGHALATWHHDDPDRSDGGAEPVRFEFFWAHPPDEVQALIAGHDAFLTKVPPRRNSN